MALTREVSPAALQSTPRRIALLVGLYLAVDLFALHVCNADAQVFSLQGSSESSSALSVTAMAAVNLYLSFLVLRSFRRGEPLRFAWMAMTLSAAAQVTSGVLSQIGELRLIAQIGGDQIRLGLLAVAAIPVLRALRKFNFWVRPSGTDWAVFALVCILALCQLAEAGQFSEAAVGSLVSRGLLCILVLEAMLLRQSIGRIGSGLIFKCWTAFMCGIFLTGLSEFAVWILPHFSRACSPAVIGSLTHFPIAAIFALAPAYQLRAQRQATESDTKSPAGLATRLPALAH